ncbi:hypothetical protein GCM10011578_022460 [Streptomyces fuscichromogenes]|uniref:Uncharacterized protein n=1 Tax=Streptomyces fuscichromogenes TaxID=1324013 RepID=A0A918CPI5_9ACTN|nr:hypothetical protein GCM10011578_022460 [Streptomyces fuscichromogenes]
MNALAAVTTSETPEPAESESADVADEDEAVTPATDVPLSPVAAFAVYSPPRRSAVPAAKDATIFLLRRDDLR